VKKKQLDLDSDLGAVDVDLDSDSAVAGIVRSLGFSTSKYN